MKVKGKVAIVTGGANGIGRAIVLRLAEEGADVVVADIDVENANQVVNEIKALGRKALAIRADVTKSQEINGMVEAALDELGEIDILVNNAGGTAREGRSLFHESTEEVRDYVLSLNLKGVLICCRAVIGHMIQRQSGKIVNIASVSGMIGAGSMMQADYSAAKGGVIAFTKSLAEEVACYNINVNCVSPGPIATAAFLMLPEETRKKIENTVWLGRLGKPEDVANLVLFLVSDEASFITGQNYAVCGGRSLGSRDR
jgi:NAD(P)-dependent dehydrogenase (short-subunit alcohol dehydrogenase family)